MTRKILVTCASPYSNGPIHLGHLLEHIQADVWVRYKRMTGHEVHFVCSEDSHGTPIMLEARRLNVDPAAVVRNFRSEHHRDISGFGVVYDNYYSTHSVDNLKLTRNIFGRLESRGLISKKSVVQLFDDEVGIFLPDRFVRGTCPRCFAADQHGDCCEVCSSTYEITDLVDPRSTVSSSIPILKESDHLFLNIPRVGEKLVSWIDSGTFSDQVRRKIAEWLDPEIREWNLSRDSPYFGFRIPHTDDKYFYVWFDALIGYLSSFENLCRRESGVSFEDFWNPDSGNEVHQFIGKDIIYFHSLPWPAILEGSRLRKPSRIFVHGHVKINGLKISKSRGNFIRASTYLERLDGDYLRYYYATKITPGIEDIDLNLEDLMSRVNSDLVNKLVNLAARSYSFINKFFGNKLSSEIDRDSGYLEFVESAESIRREYEGMQLRCVTSRVNLLSSLANSYVDRMAPWSMRRDSKELQVVCSTGIELFRIMMTYLKPILPALSKRSENFLRTELVWEKLGTPLLSREIGSIGRLAERIVRNDIMHLSTSDSQR